MVGGSLVVLMCNVHKSIYKHNCSNIKFIYENNPNTDIFVVSSCTVGFSFILNVKTSHIFMVKSNIERNW